MVSTFTSHLLGEGRFHTSLVIKNRSDWWGTGGFPGGTSGKDPACLCRRHERQVWPPELGRSPGGGHGNPLHILAWRIPWTEKPGRLQSIGVQRVRHDWSDYAHTHTHEETDSFVVFHYATLHLFSNLTSIYFIPHYSMNLQAVNFQRCEHVFACTVM